MYKVRESTNKL